MLENKAVADYLAAELNARGKKYKPPYEFIVSADAGDIKDKTRALQGILNVRGNAEINPIPGFVNQIHHYRLDMFVPKDEKVVKIRQYNKIILGLIDDLNGNTVALGGGKAIFTFKTPNAHDLAVYAGIGKDLISTLHIDIDYSIGAVISSDQVWQINGNTVRYSSWAIRLQTEGAVNSVFGQRATQTLPVRQQKFYDFLFPYIEGDPVCLEIQADIMSGDMTKAYALTYWDGAAYIQANPYRATVSLYQNNSSGAVVPGVANFEVTFTDADGVVNNGWRYSMALFDNQFDSSTANTRAFASLAAQRTWYTQRTNVSDAPFVRVRAPNLNSLTITQQVYLPPSNANLESLLNKNYAVIQVQPPTGAAWENYYYFVTNATVGANNQILYDLEMDTVQTFLFRGIVIAPAVIRRAHLDRWQ